MMAPCQVTFSLEIVTCIGREIISVAAANSIHILANFDYCNTHTMGSQDIHTYIHTYVRMYECMYIQHGMYCVCQSWYPSGVCAQ